MPGPFPWDADAFSISELPTVEEVMFHVTRMKKHKTTGISGISADLCLQSWRFLRVVHGILIGASRHFQDLYEGLVILVPKLIQVMGPQQLRPIVLLPQTGG